MFSMRNGIIGGVDGGIDAHDRKLTTDPQSIYARMYKQGHAREEVDLEVAEEFGLRFLPYDMTEEGEH